MNVMEIVTNFCQMVEAEVPQNNEELEAMFRRMVMVGYITQFELDEIMFKKEEIEDDEITVPKNTI